MVRFESEWIYWTTHKITNNLLRISIEYPVGLPGEHDGVHPQAQHEEDDQHLPYNLSLDVNHFKFKGLKLLFGDTPGYYF